MHDDTDLVRELVALLLDEDRRTVEDLLEAVTW